LAPSAIRVVAQRTVSGVVQKRRAIFTDARTTAFFEIKASTQIASESGINNLDGIITAEIGNPINPFGQVPKAEPGRRD
jgi:hypothetical protein